MLTLNSSPSPAATEPRWFIGLLPPKSGSNVLLRIVCHTGPVCEYNGAPVQSISLVTVPGATFTATVDGKPVTKTVPSLTSLQDFVLGDVRRGGTRGGLIGMVQRQASGDATITDEAILAQVQRLITAANFVPAREQPEYRPPSARRDRSLDTTTPSNTADDWNF